MVDHSVAGRDLFNVAGNLTVNAAAMQAFQPLHQLPPAVGDFTGRAAELAQLRQAMTKGSAVICGVRGMGGVGKTQLALEFAHEVAEQFPAAQLYLDLRGTEREPVSPCDAMWHVVKSFNPGSKRPDDGEMATHYRSVLHGQAALLLMDNVADWEQVEPLIPPKSCLLLVTSRQAFLLSGLKVLALDVLPRAESVSLLLAIEPRIAELADDLAERCGDLPLALRLAAEHLAVHEDLAVAAYLNDLADARGALQPLEASISLSYDLLDDMLQQRWRALAVFPQDFDWAAASAVWDVGEDVAQPALGELARRSLVVYDAYKQRYRLHDLLREFADRCLSPEDRKSVEFRHARHYATLLSGCNQMYLDGAAATALIELEVDWANVESGVLACERSPGADGWDRLAVQYALAGVNILECKQTSGWMLALFACGREAAKRTGDERSRVIIEGNMAGPLASTGRPALALQYAESRLGLAEQQGDERGKMIALMNMGEAQAAMGDVPSATASQSQALSIACRIGDGRIEGQLAGNLGLRFIESGRIRDGVALVQRSLALARDCGDVRSEVAQFINLALGSRLSGNQQDALRNYNQAIDAARRIGDKLAESKATGGKGVVHRELGDTDEALDLQQRRLEMAKDLGHRAGEATAHLEIGLVHSDRAEYDAALAHLKQAHCLDTEIGNDRAAAHARGSIGVVHLRRGNLAQAQKAFEEQLRMTEELGDQQGAAEAAWNLGACLWQQGDVDVGFALKDRAVAWYQSVSHPKAAELQATLDRLRALPRP